MKKKILIFLIIISIGALAFISSYLYFSSTNQNNPTIAESNLSDNITTTPTEPTSIPVITETETEIEVINDDKTTVLFTGDAMLSRTIGESISDGQDPFENVKEIFAEHDFVIINLETTIGDSNNQQNKLFTFQAPTESIDLIQNAGVDAVSLANNHTLDYGREGLQETIDLLENSNIDHFGAGDYDNAFKPYRIAHNGNTIDIFGYNNRETSITAVEENRIGNAYFNEDKIQESFDNSASDGAVIISFVHWGEEFTTNLNSFQTSWAQKFIDNEADIVIGSHPHIVQPNTEINGVEVFYSLGNFIFDDMYLDAARGLVLSITIQENQIVEVNPINIQLEADGFPRVVGD